jgi:hypothetical protein
LFAFATAAFAAEVTWDTIIRLTTNPASQVTGYSSQHSIAVDAAGNVHVAWLDQRNVPYQVWYRRFDAGSQTWLAETALTVRSANCFRPGMACDSAGNVHLAWHVESFQGTGIWVKRYNATTYHWRADTLIDSTSTSQPQQYPSVACVPGTGDVAVAWYGSPDTGMYSQVFLRERHSATGWDTATQVSEASVSHDQVSVAAGTNGDLVVVWVGKDFGNDYNQVYCRRRVGSAWQGTELVSDVPLALSQYSPCVAFDREGAVHVVWHGRSMMNTYQQVFHRERDSLGWGGIDSVSGERAYQQQYPSVACDAAGRCHVAWCGKGGSDHTQLIYAQQDTDGVWSSPMILTGLDSGDVSYPSIACDADSGIHIVWHDASSGNPDVYYLRGIIPGSSAVESHPPSLAPRCTRGATIVRASMLQTIAGKLQAGLVVFDASGRPVDYLKPGVYFVRSSDGAHLAKVVVVR